MHICTTLRWQERSEKSAACGSAGAAAITLSALPAAIEDTAEKPLFGIDPQRLVDPMLGNSERLLECDASVCAFY